MKYIYIVANWKMNFTNIKEIDLFFTHFTAELQKIKEKKNQPELKKIKIIIAPPFIWLSYVKKIFQQIKTELNCFDFNLAAQDCFWENQGSFTGEISPVAIKNIGCHYVILGHSERKIYLQETTLMVNLKLKKTLEVGLTPLLCLGSTQKDFSKSEQEIFLQLQDILAGVERELLKKIIFVYEPIWAIKGFGGTPCTPEKAEQGVLLITQFLKKLYCERSEQQGSEAKRTGPYSDIENEKLNFLYGGSVDSKNGYTFLQTGSINGLLIGQASIKPQELTQIIQSCLNYV